MSQLQHGFKVCCPDGVRRGPVYKTVAEVEAHLKAIKEPMPCQHLASFGNPPHCPGGRGHEVVPV